MAEPKDGESMLRGHGGMREDFEDSRVTIEGRDGEGGESVPVKPNSGPESGEGSSVEFVSLGFGKSCNVGRGG